MNVRASKRWILSTGPIALALVLGACNGTVGDTGDEIDAELTAAEVALLPAPEQEADTTALAAAETDPVGDDAALFDDDEAVETDDALVDDETDGWQNQALVADAVAAGSDATPTPERLETSTPPVATPDAALLKWGLHPRASDALRSIGVSAARIMQTIGNAAASAGTHAQDGVVNG
ncbi:MAG TPA: hypothetical protein VF334_11730, partial [Polyangia bacterium]